MTGGDLTEGFALDPSGFARNLVFESSRIEILPEPATALLLVLAAPIALRRRRSPIASAIPNIFIYVEKYARRSVRADSLALTTR